MTTISVSDARQTLPLQLDRVAAGEEIEITRHGRVVAVLVHPDLLAARRAPEAWRRADLLAARLAEASKQPLHPASLSAERADELVAELRSDRAAR